jgi:D,D-heptose 1,7-bisphosphate phosphatase
LENRLTESPARKAVFLDKDGTILEDVPYNVDPAKMRFTDGAAEGLRMLAQAGFLLVVVSNQSGIARGYFPASALEPVLQQLDEMFREAGVELAAFYYCPHLPDGAVPEYSRECDCRKPAPGLILRAANELSLDLNASWTIGDKASDIEAGTRAGCRPVRMTGNFLDAARTVLAG